MPRRGGGTLRTVRELETLREPPSTTVDINEAPPPPPSRMSTAKGDATKPSGHRRGRPVGGVGDPADVDSSEAERRRLIRQLQDPMTASSDRYCGNRSSSWRGAIGRRYDDDDDDESSRSSWTVHSSRSWWPSTRACARQSKDKSSRHPLSEHKAASFTSVRTGGGSFAFRRVLGSFKQRSMPDLNGAAVPSSDSPSIQSEPTKQEHNPESDKNRLWSRRRRQPRESACGEDRPGRWAQRGAFRFRSKSLRQLVGSKKEEDPREGSVSHEQLPNVNNEFKSATKQDQQQQQQQEEQHQEQQHQTPQGLDKTTPMPKGTPAQRTAAQKRSRKFLFGKLFRSHSVATMQQQQRRNAEASFSSPSLQLTLPSSVHSESFSETTSTGTSGADEEEREGAQLDTPDEETSGTEPAAETETRLPGQNDDGDNDSGDNDDEDSLDTLLREEDFGHYHPPQHHHQHQQRFTPPPHQQRHVAQQALLDRWSPTTFLETSATVAPKRPVRAGEDPGDDGATMPPRRPPRLPPSHQEGGHRTTTGNGPGADDSGGNSSSKHNKESSSENGNNLVKPISQPRPPPARGAVSHYLVPPSWAPAPTVPPAERNGAVLSVRDWKKDYDKERQQKQQGDREGSFTPITASPSPSPTFSESSAELQQQGAEAASQLEVAPRKSCLKSSSWQPFHSSLRSSIGPVVEPRLRCVSFDRIRIREYERAIGDNPSCSSGPPITLGWSYVEALDSDVEEYERIVKGGRPPRSKREFHLAASERCAILRGEWLVSEDDIRRARGDATYVQYCREKSATAGGGNSGSGASRGGGGGRNGQTKESSLPRSSTGNHRVARREQKAAETAAAAQGPSSDVAVLVKQPVSPPTTTPMTTMVHWHPCTSEDPPEPQQLQQEQPPPPSLPHQTQRLSLQPDDFLHSASVTT